jgi:osmoprotectant transport system substrate-binding protein
MRIALVILLLLMASCARKGITVGSKNFSEQLVLGEIVAQQIERKVHVSVDRKLNLGGTLLAHQALVNGEIDLYPEYTGTALTSVLKQKPSHSAAEAFDTASRLYHERFHLRWYAPLGFDDTFAMVVRRKDAQTLPAPNLSAATQRAWKLGVGYEFLTRPDGLSTLDGVYHFKWTGTARTMDLGLLYQALSGGQIEMAAANSTDGLLSSSEYTVLEDDKHAFPPYQACFIASNAFTEKQPAAAAAVAALSGTLDERAMRELNRRVDQGHEPIVQVAHDFLATLP